MSPRDRRIENEWRFLVRLQDENPEVLQSAKHSTARGGDWFHFTLHRTTALALPPSMALLTEHKVRMHFPEYFPAVPIEAFLEAPVLHPNVDIGSGFVCLWDRVSPGDSIVEAIQQLQNVLTWRLFNRSADHLMQPDALNPLPAGIPLPCTPIKVPSEQAARRGYRRAPENFRRRLSEI